MEELLDSAIGRLGPALSDSLASIYSRGIAFHHAGLHVQLKALVEELYEQRLVKVLYCTSTFALGINMPARCVVFDGWKKYDGRSLCPLTTRQFMQKAGRAGRRGMDEHGTVVLRMDLNEYQEAKPHIERFLRGRYEPVRSTFSLGWNSIVLHIARHDRSQIRTIVEKSFLAWHLAHRAEKHLARADALEDEKRPGARKEARKLRRRAEHDGNRCWQEFEEKIILLQSIGYLDEDWGFNAGAHVLQHVQISEILVTELVLAGVFDDLQPELFFGVVCALTNSLPRQARRLWRPDGMERAISATVARARSSWVVREADELAGIETPWDPDLIRIGRLWASGKDLEAILDLLQCPTDLSGDLITGFRRAKDLLGQLEQVYKSADPELAAQIHALARAVRRDEVEVVG